MEEVTDLLREVLSPRAAEVLYVENVPHLIVPNHSTAKAMREALAPLSAELKNKP